MPDPNRYCQLPRPHQRASWLARCFAMLCLPMLCLVLVPAFAHADIGIQLTAGEPTVLPHPHINKSVGNPVHCLTFIQEGASLATGATSGVLIWDVATGKLKQTLDVDERAVDSLVLSPSGTLLVAGGASGIIKTWDAKTLKPFSTLGPTSGAVQGLSISADGKLLASASPNGQLGESDSPPSIMLWDLQSGEALRTIPHPPAALGGTALAFMGTGKQLVSAQDRTFRVFDGESGKQVRIVEVPDLPRSLNSIALRADGLHLVTGVYEPKIRLWNTQDWTQVLAWDAHHQEPPPRRGVACVNFSPDGRYVLSGGLDGMVGVWEASSGRELLQLDARGDVSGRWITGVAMTPDNRWLAASHYGGTATLWQITQEK